MVEAVVEAELLGGGGRRREIGHVARWTLPCPSKKKCVFATWFQRFVLILGICFAAFF
jgi:hypothetical protein